MKQSKVLDACKEIMKVVVEKGFTHQIHRRELEKVIMLLRGMDKRTIRNWLKTLELLGFVKLLNPFVYALNFDECRELLVGMVKKNQKKLM